VKDKFDHADFVTHKNYISHLNLISSNLQMQCLSKVSVRFSKIKTVDQKVNLVNLTLINLKEEYKNIKQFPDYAVVCVSWIPIKSYYLIYNLAILLEYFITSSEAYLLTINHSKIWEEFKNLLSSNKIRFNKNKFNEVFASTTAASWKIPQYENVKVNNYNEVHRERGILRKILDYKIDDFKRLEKIKRLGGEKRKIYMKSTTLNMCEFFYWYRTKASYRDMQFVNRPVPVTDFKEFYENYYSFTLNFYTALKKCVNELSLLRYGLVILK